MGVALRSGEVGSIELVERALTRTEAWQPRINAFSQIWPEEAESEARRIDSTPVRDRRPLAGIPIAVKDLYDCAGRETTACCAAYRGRLAGADAPTIARVREAGLIIVGKTNQHELAAGATNLVSSCGRTGNPWDPRCMTGGSSGGSGAATAARIVPWSLGSDTGGSIRIPAAMCGTYGLKPTTGSISIEGLLPHSPSLDCPGPLAATIVDLWLLHSILSGSAPDEDVLQEAPSRRLRVAVPEGGHFEEQVEPAVARNRNEFADALAAAGTSVDTVDGRGIEGARRVWAGVAYPELYSAHIGLQNRRDLVSPPILELLDYGARLTRQEHTDALRRRDEITAWFETRLRAADALLIPTTPYPAPNAARYAAAPVPADVPLAERMGPAWLTCPINLAGLPALSIPSGVSSEGLPIGMSIVGRAGSERTLLQLALRWQQESGHEPGRPRLLPADRPPSKPGGVG
jgi:aspartyl-tRNA(Asn)/glutamyl-tRNA(Gln) amidotransferase subunit A